MPDLPIVIPDTAEAPKDYTLSGTQELALKTVRALIDGSAAASAFLPTLQLLDPNGHVMWEGATSTTVVAGGSADVSWFPGLGGQSSSAATIPDLPCAAGETFLNTAQIIAPGDTYIIPWGDVQLTNPAAISWDSGSPTVVTPLVEGIYMYLLTLSPDITSDWPAAGTGNIHFGFFQPFGPANPTNRLVYGQYPYVTYETGQTVNDETNVTTMGVTNINGVPQALHFFVTNNTAANWTLAGQSFFYLVRLSPAVVPV